MFLVVYYTRCREVVMGGNTVNPVLMVVDHIQRDLLIVVVGSSNG